jgi:DNA-binding CsgD family transcriptional regulator
VHAIIPAHTGRAAYLVAQRDYAGAIRIGERGLMIADHHGYVAWAIHRLVPALCEAALWARDFDRVTRYAGRLRRDAALLDHKLGIAWADAADALLLRRRDADPRAVEGLLKAAADLEQVPFVFHAARLRRNAAQVMAMDGDRERALQELRLAHEMFRNMGAERELRGTREEIRALGARPPQRSTPSEGALTTRERDIARLLIERKTNREIGAALDISPRTVSTHLANVFQKLEIDSRGALIDLVREDPTLLESAAESD